MADRRSGEHRSAHIEMEKLLRVAGPVMEDAIQLAIKDRAPQFRNDGPDLTNILTGQTIEEFCAPTNLRKEFPHWFNDWQPLSDQQLLDEAIEDACLSPTLTKISKLNQMLGDVRCDEVLKQWSVSVTAMDRSGNIRPGTPPEWANKNTPEAKKATNRKANPWSKEGWNVTRQGAIVRDLGMEKAAGMARSVGCVVGSTKPNNDPRFN
jgi:hypothetical protein